uniref:Putative plasmid addiction Doc protein n=1 Tax=Zymomonas mobilis subsp. mobilis str. CP4 = NRRL B-14023 TaxID=627343 RepID=B3GN66_ZYMMB|nr:type II toxin-antitoxin system death-on-curing family toxin [Zymomonas mobilis]ACE07193.1 putative plasmid addiction Doc protein [Zymomonas mobilis subsp. mobilis str. CP4 = NRRL B-14023]
MSEFITLVEALTIHTDQIDRYGGSYGIRDKGLLEAALFRPQTGYYNDLIQESAALWESLAQNHPFIDGNMRTAFAVTYTFLALNGVLISADAEMAYNFISELYRNNKFEFEILDQWLRLNTVKHYA